jgi:tetratricopeptide (TPR) repeat protein
VSKIFKKLKIESEFSPSHAPLAPHNLKLVREVTEDEQAVLIRSTSQTQKKAFLVHKFKRQLKSFLVLGMLLTATGFFGKLAYQKYSPLYFAPANVNKAVDPGLAAAGQKAAPTVDEKIHHEATELFKAKDYLKAIEKYQALLQKYPSDSALLNNSGLAYLKLNEFSKAEEQFQKVLKIDPKDAVAYNNLGTLKMAELNSDESISYFYQAILYRPEMLEPHLNLGKAFELAGRPMEAVPEYQYFLDHSKTGDPAFKKLLEKRVAKLNSFSKYVERADP